MAFPSQGHLGPGFPSPLPPPTCLNTIWVYCLQSGYSSGGNPAHPHFSKCQLEFSHRQSHFHRCTEVPRQESVLRIPWTYLCRITFSGCCVSHCFHVSIRTFAWSSKSPIYTKTKQAKPKTKWNPPEAQRGQVTHTHSFAAPGARAGTRKHPVYFFSLWHLPKIVIRVLYNYLLTTYFTDETVSPTP